MRLLLSHNYNISATIAPPLSPADFCAVFQTQLAPACGPDCQVELIDHPHWRCVITTEATVATVSQAIAQALKAAREAQLGQPIQHKILALGGRKTSPATSNNPTALQPGEWGVDVVETPDAASFLQSINWDKLISERPDDAIFQVII